MDGSLSSRRGNVGGHAGPLLDCDADPGMQGFSIQVTVAKRVRFWSLQCVEKAAHVGRFVRDSGHNNRQHLAVSRVAGG